MKTAYIIELLQGLSEKYMLQHSIKKKIVFLKILLLWPWVNKDAKCSDLNKQKTGRNQA